MSNKTAVFVLVLSFFSMHRSWADGEHIITPGAPFTVDVYGFSTSSCNEQVCNTHTATPLDKLDDSDKYCARLQEDAFRAGLQGEPYQAYFQSKVLVQIDVNHYLYRGEQDFDAPVMIVIAKDHVYMRVVLKNDYLLTRYGDAPRTGPLMCHYTTAEEVRRKFDSLPEVVKQRLATHDAQELKQMQDETDALNGREPSSKKEKSINKSASVKVPENLLKK